MPQSDHPTLIMFTNGALEAQAEGGNRRKALEGVLPGEESLHQAVKAVNCNGHTYYIATCKMPTPSWGIRRHGDLF